MANFTPSQERAIHLEGKNILVSAGAGSGKTTVLSERVVRKLISGIHVDTLMIVTFTNAAAAEMKHRIIEKITQASVEHPFLVDELDRIENAIISTFDSFALRIVKEYHYLLGLPDTIAIANAPYLALLKEQLLDELLEECYVHPTPAFEDVIKIFFTKGDKTIKEGIATLYQGAEMAPDKERFYQDLVANQFSDQQLNHLVELFNQTLALKLEDLVMRSHELQKVYLHYRSLLEEQGWDHKIPDFDAFRNLVTTIHDYEDLVIAINDKVFKLSGPYAKLNNESIDWAYEIYKAHAEFNKALGKITGMVAKLHASTHQELITHFVKTKPWIEWFAHITSEYHRRVKVKQRELGLYDFGDIMDLAIQLLTHFPSVQDSYRQRFQEIMVDEYQDTNDLQNHLLQLITKENNMFLVGDVKQSIYGFRNANPEHFVRKLKEFASNPLSEVINLKENFRSRRSVIDPVNDLFTQVMDETIGGVDYSDNQRLVYGQTLYDQSPLPEDAHAPRIIVVPPHDELSEVEVEARLVASDIARKYLEKVVTLKDKSFAPIQFKDFAILIDRRSEFDVFADALKAWGIPVQVYADESYVASSEVLVLINLFQALVCYMDPPTYEEQFRMALYGLARSFLFNIPDEEMVTYLLDHPSVSYSDKPHLANYPSLKPIHDLLEDGIQQLNQLSLPDFVLYILGQVEFTKKMLQLDDVQAVEAKLDFFLTQTATIPGLSLSGLVDLLIAIEKHPKLDIEFQKAVAPDQNAVTIMTIHKSKGLEYPHVYYPRLKKQFTFEENKSAFIFYRPIGLITMPFENGFYDTLAHQLFKFLEYRSMVSERLRLFYVALTRARETMTLVIPENKLKSVPLYKGTNGILHSMLRMSWKSYAELMNYVLSFKAYHQQLMLIEPHLIEATSNQQDHPSLLSFVDVHRDIQSVAVKSYSKSLPTDAVDPKLLLAGELFHEQLEHVDLAGERPLDGLQEPVRSSVAALLQTAPFVRRKDAIFYHEYAFINEEGIKGVIDLLIEYPDEMIIIDFKLKDIDKPEYVTQVNGYMKYIHQVTNKKVSGYLYSLTDRRMIKV